MSRYVSSVINILTSQAKYFTTNVHPLSTRSSSLTEFEIFRDFFTPACNMAAPSANEQSKDDSQSVVYAVQTAFENLDKGLLLFSSTVIYFGEMLVTHPLEVIRTSVQVSQAVCIYAELSSIML